MLMLIEELTADVPGKPFCLCPAEIGGGWLVWQTIRVKKPWYYLVAGCIALCAYGFIPTLQPAEATFNRVYAVYGGVFVIMSYGWGWAVDGDKPDLGDMVGTAVAVAGVCLCWFWPRKAALDNSMSGEYDAVADIAAGSRSSSGAAV